MSSLPSQQKQGTFIDLFSGCGGLSLGLMQAGWKGLFAIEKTSGAFETLQHNLLGGGRYTYDWPNWLPKLNMTVDTLLENHKGNLSLLAGKVDLIVGGPPCQGFSLAGKRDPDDPRNKLAEQYIDVVRLVKPKLLLLENVRGFNTKFTKGRGEGSEPYSKIVKEKLEELGYGVSYKVITSSDWGVPQRRPRFILIAKFGVPSDLFNPFEDIDAFRLNFLNMKGLNSNSPVSAKDAIYDLEIFDSKNKKKKLIENTDSGQTGFFELDYKPPKTINNYIKLLRDGLTNEKPNSLRLPRHTKAVSERFELILKICTKGTTICNEFRDSLKMKKHSLTPLHPDLPSATVTTLPDDILHYSEPRILTVRENARLQSFPDWFSFKSAYTTGGKMRKLTCPRYTQVGNAVPPLLGEAMGRLLLSYIEPITSPVNNEKKQEEKAEQQFN
ncbi:DNA cytosine methyltransferase [Aeromonas media]|uniref:DNA cytosine methyltransferase n=1 Tax=Aeromonas media TaxID=651 RepID=UPI00370B1481